VLRILVVDDEPLAASRLEKLCAQGFDRVDVTVALHARDALRFIEDDRPDVVLLDIHMPGLDGLSLAKRVMQAPSPPPVVFTTAHERFALQAFAVGAVDYLLKPVKLERLRQALQRSRRAADLPVAAASSRRSEYWVRDRSEIVRLDVGRIDLVTAEGDYMRLHAGARSYLLHTTLARLEHELDAAEFIRVHRSAMIAKRAIRALSRSAAGKWTVRLAGGRQIVVGETYVTALRAFAHG
jgi:two-component system response regulator AlgR